MARFYGKKVIKLCLKQGEKKVKIKTFFCVALLTSCLASSINASVIENKKEKNEFSIVYSGLVKCKAGIISFIKNHPFITATIAVMLMSKEMRSILMSLPRNLQHNAQRHPLVMALLGGLVLSYMVT